MGSLGIRATDSESVPSSWYVSGAPNHWGLEQLSSIFSDWSEFEVQQRWQRKLFSRWVVRGIPPASLTSPMVFEVGEHMIT